MSSTKEQTEPSTFRMIFDELMYEIKGSVCHSPKVSMVHYQGEDDGEQNIVGLGKKEHLIIATIN